MMQCTKPGGPCGLRLPPVVVVLAVLLTARVTSGQTIAQYQTDNAKTMAAAKARGSNTCYIIKHEPGKGERFVISLDKSRADRPKPGGMLDLFCEGLDPRWAVATPVGEGGGSDGDVMVVLPPRTQHHGDNGEE
ncbi:uncharacterized protein [Branchiostoma lanceolatum]|uniref:uncharacterized protein n=1 Tax=Branchiostoma lanceolatum TaxID=7740 RepID=UPI003452B4AE